MISKEELSDLKRQFAEWWISFPNEPFKAACMVFPDPKEMGNRLVVAHEWVNDPEVLLYRRELLRNEETANKALPSKHELMHDLYQLSKITADPEAAIKAIMSYAQLAGHVKQPGVQINNNNRIGNTQQTVMLVPDYGSDDEWQETLYTQQQALIAKEIDVPDATDTSS